MNAACTLVGIVSDSHDNGEAVLEALAGLQARGVTDLIHCGDVTTAATLELFRGFRFRVCLGNNDSARELSAAAERLGGSYAACLDIRIGGKRFFVGHGDREGPLNAAASCGDFHYVLYGHTHRKDDRRVGKVRVINPGALYRAPAYSYAVLDTATDALEFVAVGKPA
ncbi:MAG: YfcE family phosphodiesterase [Planctomycetes bacterium]|nr:YfcE family phosphodiesterase [Planctomycetota bacterium]